MLRLLVPKIRYFKTSIIQRNNENVDIKKLAEKIYDMELRTTNARYSYTKQLNNIESKLDNIEEKLDKKLGTLSAVGLFLVVIFGNDYIMTMIRNK